MSLHALAQAACVAVETTCCVESLKETPSTDSNAASSAESSATATNIQTSSDDTSR